VEFNNFKDFYSYYLTEHSNKNCRRLHFLGTFLGLLLFVVAVWKQSIGILIAAPIVGYFLAWAGHFIFEKRNPLVFKFPLYSLIGDFVMFWDMIRGKVKIL